MDWKSSTHREGEKQPSRCLVICWSARTAREGRKIVEQGSLKLLSSFHSLLLFPGDWGCVCVCVCVGVLDTHKRAGAPVSLCTCSSQSRMSYAPFSFSTLSPWDTLSLSWKCRLWLGRLARLTSLCLPVLGLEACMAVHGLLRGSWGIRTQVFMLAEQVLLATKPPPQLLPFYYYFLTLIYSTEWGREGERESMYTGHMVQVEVSTLPTTMWVQTSNSDCQVWLIASSLSAHENFTWLVYSYTNKAFTDNKL